MRIIIKKNNIPIKEYHLLLKIIRINDIKKDLLKLKNQQVFFIVIISTLIKRNQLPPLYRSHSEI